MKIGTMNHPAADVIDQIRLHADLGMEFLDLTFEPPAASSWRVDPEAIRRELESNGMDVVGHTSFYLPMDSAFEEVRQGAVAELKRCLRAFSVVGAKWMNIHPGRYAPFHPREFFIRRNIESLKELHEVSEEVGVGLMIENLPGPYNTPEQLEELLEPLPWLGLHLDVGHCNLEVPHNTTAAILDRWGDRLRHVHIHDNKGGHADLHLPLGAGTLDLPETVGAVKRSGYDGLITLEVFTEDKHYLQYSAEVLRRVWAEV